MRDTLLLGVDQQSGADAGPRRRRQIVSRVLQSEVLQMLGLAALTLIIAGYFAPRGFRSGFTDMAHDGYQLRQVLDLDGGGTIFKDTFEQYGPLSGYLNVLGFRLLGRNLLAVKYTISLCYAATAVLLYLLARHLLTPALSVVSVVAWLALAPFYGHGVMISPHAYILFFQALGTLAVLRFGERDRLRWLAVAGVCCGLCWASKTLMGVFFGVGIGAYLVLRVLDGRLRPRRAIAALSTFLGAAACVVASTLALLAFGGAFYDWYLQAVVFPRAAYVDKLGAGVGVFASLTKFTGRFLSLNFDLVGVPVALYWHLIRAVVVVRGFMLWKRRQAPDLLLISACLTPVLWLGAYPSANFMHQWWTASLSIAAFVYCVHGLVEVAADKWAPGRIRRLDWLLTAAALAVVMASGIEERWRYARDRATTLTETLDAPKVLAGIHTNKQTRVGFAALYSAIQNYKQHHPSARIVSQDHCDGLLVCVPESLLWLSFIDDNRRDHPIYWPLPVMTEIYPDYESRLRDTIARTRPLVVDSFWGPFRRDIKVKGYTLLVGVGTEANYWYLFAPEHAAAEEHGEVQVRVEPPADVPWAGADDRSAQSDDILIDEPRNTLIDEPRDNPLEGSYREGAALALGGNDTVLRRLYTWPKDLDIAGPPAKLDPVDPAAAGLAKIVTVDRSRWIVRGSAETPFSYLMYFKERTVGAGEYFFAAGQLEEGGVTFGLQRDETWAGLVNITAPGPFAVVLKPEPGRYSLVLANDVITTRFDLFRKHPVTALWKILTGQTLPNAFAVDRAGWTVSSAPVEAR